MAEDEPRCVHYQFAHVALRTLVFEDPRLALALWEREDPSPILDDIAVQVARACRRMTGEGGNLRAEHLKLSKREIGRHPCVILELPEPIATTEAYMVAIVHLRDLDEGEGGEGRDAERRYFTLEYSGHRPAPHTVLGEWTDQGSHINMGGGPEPTVDAFVSELAKHLLD
ncbi:hypothetical protein ACNOYE_29250 [Nannocystaceae bacterium ST9]